MVDRDTVLHGGTSLYGSLDAMRKYLLHVDSQRLRTYNDRAARLHNKGFGRESFRGPHYRGMNLLITGHAI